MMNLKKYWITRIVEDSAIYPGDIVTEKNSKTGQRFVVVDLHSDSKLEIHEVENPESVSFLSNEDLMKLSKDLYVINQEQSEKNSALNVVGKLSPEAVWVKENDSFSEEEIVIRKICRDDSCAPFYSYCSHCHSSVSCNNDEGDEVLILNPLCKKFH